MEQSTTIVMTKETLAELTKLYNNAVADKKDQFLFQGQTVLTSYAKYMIEYLTTRIK